MGEDLQVSGPMLKVLKYLIEKPKDERSGAEMAKATGVGSGTLYPLLHRMENAGWLESTWEDVQASEVGRPRRRLYRLKALGQNKAASILGELQTNAPGVLAWNR